MRNVPTTWLQARKALSVALRAPGRSQVWLAKVLGVGQPSVSGWVSGLYRPGPEIRDAIQTLLGIPASAWMTAAERSRARRIQAHVARTGTEG